MRRIVLGLALAFMASAASAQVTQTGSVFANGQWQSPQPTTAYSQACAGGAGGVVGQLGCAQPVSPADGASFANITTATTTAVKSGAGSLHALTINTYVASATITIYNNTAASGAKIATITLPSTITGDAPVTITYDVAFSAGLTVVTSGATDITVSYR
jgi:hypothetical protein